MECHQKIQIIASRLQLESPSKVSHIHLGRGYLLRIFLILRHEYLELLFQRLAVSVSENFELCAFESEFLSTCICQSGPLRQVLGADFEIMSHRCKSCWSQRERRDWQWDLPCVVVAEFIIYEQMWGRMLAYAKHDCMHNEDKNTG